MLLAGVATTWSLVARAAAGDAAGWIPQHLVLAIRCRVALGADREGLKTNRLC